MKNIFTYTENTNLFQLHTAAKSLLAKVVGLSESYLWRDFCLNKNLKSLDESKSKYATNYEVLHQNAIAYKDMLENYVDYHNYYEDKSLQDKFLNGEITEVRKLAVQSINILEAKANQTQSGDDAKDLKVLVEEIKLSLNMYLSILRDILEHDRKLQTTLLKRGVNYKEKYCLKNI